MNCVSFEEIPVFAFNQTVYVAFYARRALAISLYKVQYNKMLIWRILTHRRQSWGSWTGRETLL